MRLQKTSKNLRSKTEEVTWLFFLHTVLGIKLLLKEILTSLTQIKIFLGMIKDDGCLYLF